jgi:hypothetical protein
MSASSLLVEVGVGVNLGLGFVCSTQLNQGMLQGLA